MMRILKKYLKDYIKNRRENIKLELKATIEDMLPEPYSEADIMKVLKELGSPAKVAASYQDTPRFFNWSKRV
ncbi:hypothetical protein OL548_04620 [Lysinibacillus sp. MHQ-1]|nr:hypothetical protein OL548_04620 [Lysinibacillus sp. MHQ-1]